MLRPKLGRRATAALYLAWALPAVFVVGLIWCVTWPFAALNEKAWEILN